MVRSPYRAGAFMSALALAVLPGVAWPHHRAQAEPQIPVQRLRVPATVEAPKIVREPFTVVVPVVSWPLAAKDANLTDGFGERTPPIGGASSYHLGQDFAAATGTPILAIADGTVTAAGYDGGFGYRVEIAHVIGGTQVVTISGHMVAAPIVAAGQTVHRGEVVGYVGSTGVSTGPHLHFEVHVGGKPVDPLVWLRANVG